MSPLPAPLARWLATRGWQLHPHQAAMLACAGRPATLLIAPTGGGKTLAGFLPSLAELGAQPEPGLHTLYISPLKALAVDIRRNLTAPVAEMGLAIRIEDRTGDTSAHSRRNQRAAPPHILLTTPESLALLLSYPDAPRIFGGLRRVVVDEIHALAESKRGDQLMLGLARLQGLAPGLRRVGLSATVEDPAALARFFAPEGCEVLAADPGPEPDIAMLATAPPPWAGGGGRYAIAEILAEVRAHRTTIIFHNTRAQAELFFHALWLANSENLPIGIHHGSLDREARARTEAAMAAGELRAVVATGSLDLGLDWGAVDLVIQVGAPKNVKRLVQRIGRANHRAGAPSKAFLVPANRFEVIECWAALAAVRARELDGEPRPPGALDVLCQHLALTACAGPFDAEALFAELRRAGPYAALSRADFDACLDFCATGGYALRAYDRWHRLMRRDDRWTLRDPRSARDLRMNIGTIVETETVKVRMRRGGTPLGEIEEAFAATLSPGDSFLIGGQVVRFEGLNELTVEVSHSAARRPKIAVFSGSKFSTSTRLSARILALIGAPDPDFPVHTRGWLALQAEVSALPDAATMLVESFPHEGLEYACFWGFAGRGAMQTLGMVLTRRMEALGLAPLGFVASDCAVLIWGLEPLRDAARLMQPEALREGLAEWFEQTSVMKRAFRPVATVAGLIQRNLPGKRKSGRQAAFSSDILYDTLARHDPGHLMLRIARDAALVGMVDAGRLEAMLAQFAGRVELRRIARVPPLAAPLLLEMGKVAVQGAGRERLMEAEAARLMAAAGLQ
ncbi:ligase-associated DNA damage response DEXH box helicase [Phaeovulum sp.]|uniref:ligase-associated DNA damage response DEXH box helicase n=1 Tax=Phaeovulum sp. TaxID=2934796 RepID=UPI0027309C14|nr:ligase-associated DNA damage response DEXH box helicase [Phaeovulum sp.]MDP1667499.1 ligase-associated DNA damage response DEXH box helicase [Phaeovulum sp.]MDZ4120016.1 ligase-associated DNA damage response DEXH box helicase [Phaeovulum sp.]